MNREEIIEKVNQRIGYLKYLLEQSTFIAPQTYYQGLISENEMFLELLKGDSKNGTNKE